MTTQKAFKAGSEFPAYTPGTVRLYSMRWCPYAQRARIVLDHKNIKYEVVNINLREKPEWFLKNITSLGKVPALQMDDKIVFESTVVCDYLDEIYPINKLTPSDPYQKAKDAMFMEIYSKVPAAFYKMYFNKDPANAPETVKGIQDALEVVEQELETRNTTFLGGEQPMMVDFMMWPHMERINAVQQINPQVTLDKGRLTRVFSWIERMLAVRAIKNTAESAEFYKKMMMESKTKGTVDYDFGLEE